MSNVSEDDIRIGFTILNEASLRGSPEMNEKMAILWHNYLINIDSERFISACIKHVAISPFFPTISDILTLCFENTDHLPVEEIWTNYKNNEPEKRNPLVVRAFNLCGINGFYFKSITSDTAIRFIKPSVEKTYLKLLDRDKVKMIDNICKQATLSYDRKKELE